MDWVRALSLLISLSLVGLPTTASAVQFETKPDDAFFAKFEPTKAPAPGKLLLKTGDRLAICGDSITEQKAYSRIIETYLTVCRPDLKITARQFGWSGDTAEGFLGRMTHDCLRFKPTVATTCYGMNDFKYRPYDETTAHGYGENSTAIVRAFKAAGARVVLGSPGCIGKFPTWVPEATGTLEDHNLNLCALRNIDVEIARQEGVRFADVFWPMLTAGFAAREKYGPRYAIAGDDGVHPGWAGHLVMAYAYLRAMGVDGDIGTITVNLKTRRAKATAGHTVDGSDDGVLTITSRRYPFCATGALNHENSIRSAMTLVPFNQELNRFILIAKGCAAANCKVTWGPESRTYSAVQLAKGVNLADDFAVNPFSDSFKQVDEAVAAKQAYETKQIKESFHSAEASSDMTAVVAKTEAERAPLASAIQAAFVPVTHTIKIEPL